MIDIDIFDGYYNEQCICQEQLYGTGNIWIGQDQTHYKLNKMVIRHIKNCINMLKRKLMRDKTLEECCINYIESRIDDLQSELNRRNKWQKKQVKMN